MKHYRIYRRDPLNWTLASRASEEAKWKPMGLYYPTVHTAAKALLDKVIGDISEGQELSLRELIEAVRQAELLVLEAKGEALEVA